jgi:hypothetical protein
MSDEEIEQYLVKHEAMKSKFDVFIQLKQILSPIVEYVILLDRLVFLYEQEEKNTDFKMSNYLVKLFDPAISPRCHALISFVK